jgi:uncharacterized cupin superfamily protein/predicted enzyme related to lactoylglutathione lyase
MAIIGVHAIMYTRDAEADRAWFADVLGLESVDAGSGWLIFQLPPTELAAHPVSREGGDVALYLMCDDIQATMHDLGAKGVAFEGGVTEERWGRVIKLALPSGARLGLYEPRHASPLRSAETDKPFIVNVADAKATARPGQAIAIDFESADRPWRDTGVNIMVMHPGQPNCLYHREPVQEDFLVLHGECVAIVDGDERPMRQWDFLHCPAGADHVFVGAGDGPCAVLMIGSRRLDQAHYPVNETAAKYGASVQTATDVPAEAYAAWRTQPRTEVTNPWPLA